MEVWLTATSLVNEADEIYAIATTERKINQKTRRRKVMTKKETCYKNVVLHRFDYKIKITIEYLNCCIYCYHTKRITEGDSLIKSEKTSISPRICGK